ncbi:hypothetical protein D9619_004057 [Psilocybe cf. subviscida]|uniref:Uncharacterized protein n=1 Tax=Psilocybe cf. subviscida TaxID=2480587 RepID=A0A8H5BQE7_9AGAR|nr:hypothetical protein D9619_004057 [Psilocybe cf. subviscida]
MGAPPPPLPLAPSLHPSSTRAFEPRALFPPSSPSRMAARTLCTLCLGSRDTKFLGAPWMRKRERRASMPTDRKRAVGRDPPSVIGSLQ